MGQEKSQPMSQPIDESKPFDFDEANKLFNNGNFDYLIRLCEIHISKKNADACYTLGKLYSGIFVTKKYFDYDNAIKYFELAIEYGNTRTLCLTKLAEMYFYGYDDWCKKNYLVKKISKAPKCNYVKSFELFNKAIDEGDSISFHSVGIHYENGFGVPIDYKLAMKNYIEAYENGHKYVIDHICNLFLNEKGHNMDSDECLTWMYKKLDDNSSLSTYDLEYLSILLNLAKIYMARKNYEKAMEYCNDAIKKNIYHYESGHVELRKKCQKLINEILIKQEIHRIQSLRNESDKIKQMEKIINEQKNQIDQLLSIAKPSL
ncbi:MAG: hypothetical protein Edafosvirus13_9 [Edafosvirus sp.]|uniref:Uncharacterized protein n=1 Tax=Edafosvirus sp. TaxID=2487765 RepID=A0A3G4ZVS0_9VIRU|nr:MAG: hypothetical protein Edafosvirus13_9 [Edafosvirus sp.]